jgi:hypothetical protein
MRFDWEDDGHSLTSAGQVYVSTAMLGEWPDSSLASVMSSRRQEVAKGEIKHIRLSDRTEIPRSHTTTVTEIERQRKEGEEKMHKLLQRLLGKAAN